ncbi:MAG TPA: mechanosensitive ion channel domain-containing protein [Nitrospirota bacterium]|nr:mechanosensitive ion channel domain-containing protein [Nitrospirota bacterium]
MKRITIKRLSDIIPGQCRVKLSCALLLFTVFFLCQPAALRAQQLPQVIANKDTSPKSLKGVALPVADEEIDNNVDHLESRIEDLRNLSSSAAEALRTKDAELLIATPDDLRKRQKLLSELENTLNKNVEILKELKERRKEHRDRTAEINAWQGFTEKPPFPISFLDNLHDSILAQNLDMQTLEVRLKVAMGDLQSYSKGLKNSQKEVRLAEELLDKSKGTSEEPRRRWIRDMAKLQNDLNEAGTTCAETQRLVLEEVLKDSKQYVKFLQLKLDIAEKASPLSKSDLEKKLQELDGQRRGLEDELSKALRNDADARKGLQQARDALAKVREKIGQGKQPTPRLLAELNRLQPAVSAQETVVEANSAKIRFLKGMMQMLDTAQTIWEDRYWLTQNSDLQEINEKLEWTKRTLDGIKLWKKDIEDRLSNWVALVQSQREKLNETDKTEAERRQDRIILNAYEERQAMLLRASEYLARGERLANRLYSELNDRQQHAPLKSHIKKIFAVVGSLLKSVWNTELYVAEETVIAEGSRIARPIGVTVGKVIKALILLVVGTWAAYRLIKPIRWIITRRFRQTESAAEQASKVVFLFMFIGIFVISLVFVNIPLAVFTFLGGALAIGIGFGGQHLINNFISGLILLFDRSVKLGDVVEVDGEAGRVTSIGLRSSIIKRFDGVELLVPNSQFLQQKVTNWTLSDKRMRYSISVGVAYSTDTRKASELILNAVEDHGLVLKDPAPVILLEQFTDSSLTFTVYFWLDLEPDKDNRVILSDIRHHITVLLNKAGIVIAFPQRDIHLDSVRPIEVKVIPAEHTPD